MRTFTNILVDIDASMPAQPALERALRLARASGAKLTVVDVMNVPPEARRYLSAKMAEELVRERREQLERVARSISGVQIESKLLLGRPGTVLIQEVLRSGHDLLVRSHARDLVSRGHGPYGAIDTELFRKCPCPVLIVGPGALRPAPIVVGAVNASSEDPVEKNLNVTIIEFTLTMARLEGGSARLLHAWEPFAAELVRAHASESDFTAYVEAARRQASEDFERLVAPYRGNGVEAVLLQGRPEDVIPEFVIAHDVDLVVMGTVARRGFARLLIGNTAERVLRKLPCSVLAVKPDGFVSPVRLDEA